MLLYIGERGDMHCLQEISDKLQQAICLFYAPENPEELIKLAGPQYTHYIVDIACYSGRQKELIRALKKLVGSMDGQLILLAVDMTSDHPMINELIYAGFTNIIFGQDSTKERSDTLPLLEDASVTQPLTTEPMEIAVGETEAMEEPIRETEFMAIAPYPKGEMAVVKKEKEGSKQSGNSRGNYGWKVFTYGCCILSFFLFFSVCYQKIVLMQPDTMYKNEEQYLEGEAKATVKPTAPMVKATVKPEVPMVKTTVKPEMPMDAPQVTPDELIIEPVITDTPSTEPIVTEPPVIASPVVDNEEEEEASQDDSKSEEKEKQESIPIQNISLPSSIRMVTGKSIHLEVNYTPSNAKNNSFSWKSSDSTIASVKNGKVYAKKSGKVRITVSSDNGKKAVCSIIVASQ